jgi:hypothetical protein
VIAVKNTLEALANGKDRILLTLATGTGKTAIAFQIAWETVSNTWTVSQYRRPVERQGDQGSCFWPTEIFWLIRQTTPFLLYPTMHWYA